MLKTILTKLFNFKLEPARAIANITTAITAVGTLLALWGIPMNDSTQKALIATSTTLIPVLLVMANVIRQLVTATPVAHEAVVNALNIDPNAPATPPTPERLLQQAKATA